MPIIPVRGRRSTRKAVFSAYNTLVYAVGAYLQSYRVARGLDQGTVASQANIDQSDVSGIENGHWDEMSNERLRAYIRVVRIPNEARVVQLIDSLDKVHSQLPAALS